MNAERSFRLGQESVANRTSNFIHGVANNINIIYLETENVNQVSYNNMVSLYNLIRSNLNIA